jgi:hypothetical protein
VIGLSLFKIGASGLLPGLAGAALMVVLLRFHHIPEYLESVFTLMIVVVVYTVSDLIQAESGLLSATIMGIALANQRWVVVQHIIQFKENLRILLISSLFILLAARVDMGSLELLGASSFYFLLALILVVRPATVFLSTLAAGLTWRDKVFASWMAPRGIVAAAVSSVFALRLEAAGYDQAELIVPVVFSVIVGTVLFYGLTAGPVARRLGIAGGAAQGCLILGAHPWARTIARALIQEEVPVLLVDSNRENVLAARLEGVPVFHGNILAEEIPEKLPMEDLGRLLALTANDEVNTLAAIHLAGVLGKHEVYQLSAVEEEKEEKALSRRLRGRILFAKGASFNALSQRFREGMEIKVTSLSGAFDYEAFRERYPDSLLLFAKAGNVLRISVAGEKLEPKPGQKVIAVVRVSGAEATGAKAAVRAAGGS